MKPAGRARTRAPKKEPKRIRDAFDAQQRWVLIGMGVLLVVALISFALDWFRDPIVHRVLLILLAIAGVGVIVVIPLGLGASAVFWRTKLRADRVGSRPRGRRVPRATYLAIGLGALAVGIICVVSPSWRGWLWPLYVIVSAAAIGWRILARKN
jgi:hypothetical protein